MFLWTLNRVATSMCVLSYCTERLVWNMELFSCSLEHGNKHLVTIVTEGRGCHALCVAVY